MKKLLLSLILFPMMAFGVTTNKLDNILNTGTFQRPTGAGVGNIWTSDAAGFGTWAVPGVASGPFAVTNDSNFFTIASTNTFNAATFTSNMYVRGYLYQNTNDSPNVFTSFTSYPVPGQSANRHTIFASGGSLADAAIRVESTGGGYSGMLGLDGGGNVRLDADPVLFGNFHIRVDGAQQITLESDVVTLGNNASDVTTINGATITLPHEPQINTDVLKIPSAGGTLTNGTSIATLNTTTTSNLVVGAAGVGITTSGATNFVWTPGNIATLATAVTNVSVTGITKGSAVMMSPNVFVSGLIWKSYCTNDGLVTATINNFTALGIDPGVHTNHIRFFNP